ncbi:glutamate--tRNA ligase [Thermoproteota archaeon]
MDKKAEKAIRNHVLLNAFKFGKSEPGRIIGKILGEMPELRNDMSLLTSTIGDIVVEVNKMKKDDIEKELKKSAPELLEKKEEKPKVLPELKGAEKGKVVTRIPPEPSKYNHLGHALSFLINYIYAQKYNGKCILRFEDTNPVTAKQEYVDAMKEDVLDYLDIKPDKVVYVSDDMDTFYEYAAQLINDGHAYFCACERDTMQDQRHKGIACEHTKRNPDENMKEWKNMLSGKYREGECCIRLKIDMKSKNHVMRDPVILRIVEGEHYRQGNKFLVWPMYDFENAVEEHLTGVTHILRSSEFGKMRIELQEHIKKILGLNQQIAVQYGRFNVIGAVTQGREIRQMIEEQKVMGWDDPRLVTLKALKRRGIVKDAFYELVNEVGLSRTQTNIDFRVIAAINRRLLDASAHRYFFVKDPVEVTVEGAPEQNIELDLHPDNKKGGRKLKTADKFYLAQEDIDLLKPKKLYRLMDCLNFTESKKKYSFDSTDHEKYKKQGEKIIHWLPVTDELVEVEIMMDDGSLVRGLGEPAMKNLKVGDTVQLERFGFCRLDEITESRLVFWFGHR